MTDEEKAESQVEEVSDSAEGTPAAGEGIPAENSEMGVPKDLSGEKINNTGGGEEEDAEAAMLAMLEDLPDDEKGASPDDIKFDSPEVSNARFQHLSEPASIPEARNIDILMDVNLPVAIELGRTKMSISEILGMGPGSVVELNKLAGEPVDVLVNYKIVAKGEVVVIDENFGVRITQLMTPEERLKMLCEED